MDFLNSIPVMDRTALRELKKGIDLSFKEFSRAYGDGIESFFDPLLYFLIWLEKLLVNSPWPLVIGAFALLAWIGSRSIKLVIGTVICFLIIGIRYTKLGIVCIISKTGKIAFSALDDLSLIHI